MATCSSAFTCQRPRPGRIGGANLFERPAKPGLMPGDGINPLDNCGPVFRADIAAVAHIIADRQIHRNAGGGDALKNINNGFKAGCWGHGGGCTSFDFCPQTSK